MAIHTPATPAPFNSFNFSLPPKMRVPQKLVPCLSGLTSSRNPTISHPRKRKISATTRACPEAPQITILSFMMKLLDDSESRFDLRVGCENLLETRAAPLRQ